MTASERDRAAYLCGCEDAERTYEQLLDYTAKLGATLDRQTAVVAAARALTDVDMSNTTFHGGCAGNLLASVTAIRRAVHKMDSDGGEQT